MPNGFFIQVASRVGLRFFANKSAKRQHINSPDELNFDNGGKAVLREASSSAIVVARSRSVPPKRRPAGEFGSKALPIIGPNNLQNFSTLLTGRNLLSRGNELSIRFTPGLLDALSFTLSYQMSGESVQIELEERDNNLIFSRDQIFGSRNQDEAGQFSLELSDGTNTQNIPLGRIAFDQEEILRTYLKDVFHDLFLQMKRAHHDALWLMDEEGYEEHDLEEWLEEQFGIANPENKAAFEGVQFAIELPEQDKFRVAIETGFHERAEQSSPVILRFRIGDQIAVLQQESSAPEDGWWQADFNGVIGWVKHTGDRLVPA